MHCWQWRYCPFIFWISISWKLEVLKENTLPNSNVESSHYTNVENHNQKVEKFIFWIKIYGTKNNNLCGISIIWKNLECCLIIFTHVKRIHIYTSAITYLLLWIRQLHQLLFVYLSFHGNMNLLYTVCRTRVFPKMQIVTADIGFLGNGG